MTLYELNISVKGQGCVVEGELADEVSFPFFWERDVLLDLLIVADVVSTT